MATFRTKYCENLATSDETAPYNITNIKLGTFVSIVTEQLKTTGKHRLTETYISTINSFMQFRGNRGDVNINDINSDMIIEYESFLKDKGLVPNTTSFYMRNLRAIYNKAVERGMAINRSPFSHVYTGIDRTVKRAISSLGIRKIKNLDLSSRPSLEFSRDLFLFSFYTRGMAFIDMAFLKKKNLKNGILIYRRQKTDRQLCIKWEKPMQEIVSKYRNDNSPFLLPIITRPGYNERRQYLSAIHHMNNNLKEIGAMIKSPIVLSSYVARHGWASIAKNNNIPLSVISEAMGHDSENTTRIYLASFDNSVIDKANSAIIKSIL